MNKTPTHIRSKHRVAYLKTGPKSLSNLFGKTKLRAVVSIIFCKKKKNYPKFPRGHFFMTKWTTTRAAKVDPLVQNTRRTSLMFNI